MTSLPRKGATGTGEGEISTFGWDTAFAVRIENVNAAIKARKVSPPGFHYVDPHDAGIYCAGCFGDWRIVRGGDGGGVNVLLPIAEVRGQARSGSGYTPYTWAGGSMTFTIRLEFFDAGEKKRHLRVKPDSDDPGVPVVEYYGGDYSKSPDPAWALYALQAAVTAWCTANLADFGYVFAVADLNEEADKGAWAFLKPTTVSYSYVDGESDEDAFLGVLAMTGGRSAADLQQVIDKRIVQSGEEGAFCISRALLLERLIAPNLLRLWPALASSQLAFGEQSITLKPEESVDLPTVTHQGTEYVPELKEFSFTIEGPQITVQAYTETRVQDGVTAWSRTTARYTLVRGTNKKGETTLAFTLYGSGPNPQTSHGHHIAEWVKITDAILALVAAIAALVLVAVTDGAAVPVIAVVGALISGAIGLSPTLEGLIANDDAPAIDLLQENIYNPMVWTASQDFAVHTVDLDGSLRLGGSLGFGGAPGRDTSEEDHDVSTDFLETFGWDLVYAITLAKANDDLQQSGRLPATFAKSTDSGTSVSGHWGGWNLVSAPSNFLNLVCTVAAGSADFGRGPESIAGSRWTVQLGLELADAGGGRRSLRPTAAGVGSPRVVEHGNLPDLGADVYKLIAAMDLVLREQVLALGDAFASIVLGGGAAPGKPWLVPAEAAFASEPLPGDPRGGVFALLAMTEGRSAGRNQVAVDSRVLDGATAGADSALVLGPRLVVEQMLLPALAGLVQGSTVDDFQTDPTGTVAYNRKRMTWGTFTYDLDDGSTSNVRPVISKGDIELALDGEELHLTMANVHFAYPGWEGPGEITISFDAQQFITFDFILRRDGGLVMVPQGGKYDSFTVTVVPSKEVRIFQIGVNVAVQVLFAVLGGIMESLGEAATTAAEDALEEGAGGSVTGGLNEADLGTLVSEHADAEAVEEAEIGAAEEAGGALVHEGDAGFVQKFKASLMANKWKALLKVVEKTVTFGAGQITNIAVAAAKKDYARLPALNTFAEDGFSPVTWAEGSRFILTGGALQGALVFWGRSARTGLKTRATEGKPPEGDCS